MRFRCLNVFVIILLYFSVNIFASELCIDANMTVSSYDELRNINGNSGDKINIENGLISGCFEYSDNDITGIGDDNGITISSLNGGYWNRNFDYDNNNPIEMDWFELNNGEDITNLFSNIAQIKSPEFYVRVPTNINELNIDIIDFSQYGIEYFYLFESENPIKIIKINETQDKMVAIHIKDYREVFIGGDELNLNIEGTYDGPLTGYNSFLGQYNDGLDKGFGLVSLRQDTTNGEFAVIKANFKNGYGAGFDHQGASRFSDGTKLITISGKFESSGIRLNDGINEVFFDNIIVSDPYVKNLGWTGNSYPNNNGYEANPNFYSRFVGVSMVYINRVYGEMTLEYGTNWFMSIVYNLGNGADDRFKINYKDLGYSITGEKVSTVGFLAPGGKVDGIGDNGPGNKFIEFEELEGDFPFYQKSGVIYEVSSEDGHNGPIYTNGYIDTKFTNLHKSVNTGLVDYIGDYSKGHRITGEIIDNQISLFDTNYVYDFETQDILFNYIERIEEGSRNNYVTNTKISESGKITAKYGTYNNTLNNVEFLGNSREIIIVDNLNNDDNPVELFIEELDAPKGSTIVSHSRNNVQVYLDSNEIKLPYIIDDNIYSISNDSLILDIDFENYNQTHVIDRSSSYNHLQIYGSQNIQSSIDSISSNYYFNDANMDNHLYVQSDDFDLSQNDDEITIIVWSKFNQIDEGAYGGLFGHGELSDGFRYYYLNSDIGKYLGGNLRDSLGNYDFIVNSRYLENNLVDDWHQYVLRLRVGDTVQLYYDGVLVDSSDITHISENFNNKNFYFGKTLSNQGPINGKIDNIKVYNRYLSNAEIAKDYQLIKGYTYDIENPSTPENLEIEKISESQIKLNWDKSKDDLSINKYEIYRNSQKIDEVEKIEYLDYNFNLNDKYKILAVDVTGKKSDFSNEIFISVLEETESESSSEASSTSSEISSNNFENISENSFSLLNETNLCEPLYQYESWSECVNLKQNRKIIDLNSCREETLETRTCDPELDEIGNLYLNSYFTEINKVSNRQYEALLKIGFDQIIYSEDRINQSFILVNGNTGEEYLARLIDEDSGKYYYNIQIIDQNLVFDLITEEIYDVDYEKSVNSFWISFLDNPQILRLLGILIFFLIIISIFTINLYVKKIHK